MRTTDAFTFDPIDRCAAAFGTDYEQILLHDVPELMVNLDDYAGAEWLNTRLEPYRAAIAYPDGEPSLPEP